MPLRLATPTTPPPAAPRRDAAPARLDSFLAALGRPGARLARRQRPRRRAVPTRRPPAHRGGRRRSWPPKVTAAVLASCGCPARRLGARLSDCDVVDGTVLCRWHGMPLDRDTVTGDSQGLAAFDDGVLVWVRVGQLEPGVEPTDRPVLADRPPLEESIASVISLPTTCEPRDIIATTGSTHGTAPGCTPLRLQATCPSTTTSRRGQARPPALAAAPPLAPLVILCAQSSPAPTPHTIRR